jgi:KilA-N domain
MVFQLDYIHRPLLKELSGEFFNFHRKPIMSELVIADVAIRQDSQNRYCLNDLHKAAGNENKHRPSLWLKNKQTVELIAEIEKAGIPAIQSKQQLGTFAVKPLVYAYAMWISPIFHLHVIEAYDALVTGHVPDHVVKAYDELVANKIPEYLKIITAPLPVAEFEERYHFHKTALENLQNAQIIIAAKDFLTLKQSLRNPNS